VRTLVISDLHLGDRLEHGVLTRPEPLARLLAALDGVERLVLLGDIVELMEGRSERAMSIAEPILRSVARRLPEQAEVVIVPGNHDKPMVREWVRARRSSLSIDTEIPLTASPTLGRLASWFAPARVRVHYPGVWLSERVWASHGHYLDRHLVPVSAYGVTRGLLRRAPNDFAHPLSYERARRPSASRATRWLPRPAASAISDLAELLRASTMPDARQRLLRRRLAPLASSLLGLQMRHAAIPAFAHVAHRLGVRAEWVIFGHVHRLGPLPGDDAEQWRGADGRPAILNTGSWRYEPLLVHDAAPPHPYWPGGAVVIDDGEAPRAIGLLDDVSPAALRAR
jgi:UDP-2,3-diacylglucosamine pyrophosphatase LpxH